MPTRTRLAPLALAACCALAPAGPLAQEGAAAAPPDAPAEAGWSPPRHAAHERFFLTPGARVLERGTVVLSDDEVLLLHLGIGASRRLQLDLTVGGLPLPGAAGGAVPGHGVLAGGGAGVVLLGVVSVGAKVRIVEEGRRMPGVAAAYDMVDLFGGAIGGAGFVILGNGIAGGGAGAIGAANVQLNVFSLAADKQLGRRFRLGAGAIVVDNHHFLPQVAGFTAGTTYGTTSSGSTTISRLPTKILPFANVEVWLGGGFSSIAEAFPLTSGETFGTAGFRWVSGRTRRTGIASFARVKLDAAAAWGRAPATSTRGARLVVFPWLGFGPYLG